MESQEKPEDIVWDADDFADHYNFCKAQESEMLQEMEKQLFRVGFAEKKNGL